MTDDQDQDGFRDLCEQRIAEFFRPNAVIGSNDATRGHEPYWAVNGGELGAELFWAFAYYQDGGAFNKSGPYCGTILDNTYEKWSCDGHSGDSESVVINISYNATTKHWELNSAEYSQHGNYEIYYRSQLEYAGPTYGYPTVYVAYGKHANYQSNSACNAGGFGGSDECINGVAAREYFSAYRNLGSSAHNLLNCVESYSGPSAGTGRQECFWATAGSFRGWTGLSNAGVAQYGVMLGDNLF